MARFTNKVSEALTDCRIRIEDSWWNGGSNDMASGAKGKYRFLQFNKDQNNPVKYEDAVLVRNYHNWPTIKDTPSYNVMTGDINSGRGGSYLMLAFRSREAFEIKHITT